MLPNPYTIVILNHSRLDHCFRVPSVMDSAISGTFTVLPAGKLLDVVDTLNYKKSNRRIFDVKVVFELHKFRDGHYVFIEQSSH